LDDTGVPDEMQPISIEETESCVQVSVYFNIASTISSGVFLYEVYEVQTIRNRI